MYEKLKEAVCQANIELQTLMQYICRAGFEHYVAVSICQKADTIAEALDNYMGWEIYKHV